MKKIAVVTGGAGFIGSHMVDLLLTNNFNVRIVDNLVGGHLKNIEHHKNNSRLQFLEKDINTINPNNSFFKDAEFVFHFAGIGDIVPSIENPTDYLMTNTMGTVKVLEASRFNNIKKFIYAASSSCYGIANTPTDEKHIVKPLYPYAMSKYAGEQYALHWNMVYNLPVISIRIFNAYGVRVRTTGAYGAVFGVFLKQKLEKKPFTVVGDGTQSRDFIYVTDICEAFLTAAKSDFTNQIFNIGEGKAKTINELIHLLGSENGIVNIPNRPGEPSITLANIKKIKKLLKWTPKVSFDDGIKKMLENIDDWDSAPLWDPKSIEKATKFWFRHMK